MLCMTQIVIRADAETTRALEHLVQITGGTKSDVVRDAIRAAERDAVLRRVLEQSEAVRNDPADRAEMLAVAEDLEALRAW